MERREATDLRLALSGQTRWMVYKWKTGGEVPPSIWTQWRKEIVFFGTSSERSLTTAEPQNMPGLSCFRLT